MRQKFSIVASTAIFALGACQLTEPVVETATQNVISISYEAWDTTPTLTAEAIDIAMEHCRAQGGLYANYKGVTVPDPLFSPKEIHTFACERTKTDDNAVIAAQNARYSSEATELSNSILNSIQQSQPTYTTCSTVGYQTTCETY